MIKKLSLLALCLVASPKNAQAMNYDGKKLAVLAATGIISCFAFKKGYNWWCQRAASQEALARAREEIAQDPEALHNACRTGDFEKVTLLVAAGASVDALDSDKHTPLHRATDAGHQEVVRVLLNHQAKVCPQIRGNGYTALHCAIANNDEAMVTLFLEDQAVMNSGVMDVKHNGGDTPVCFAAAHPHGRKEIVELFIKHGALEDDTIITSLSRELHRYAPDMIELLFPYVRAHNFKGCPIDVVLARAASKSSKKVIQLLLESAPSAASHISSNSDILCGTIDSGRADVVEFLLNNNAPINLRNGTGDTPLNIAVGRGDQNMVKLLLSYNACINSQTLLEAACKGDIDMVHVLMSNIFFLPGNQPALDIKPQNLMDRCYKMLLDNIHMCDEETTKQVFDTLKQHTNYSIVADAVSFSEQQEIFKLKNRDEQNKFLDAHSERHLKYLQSLSKELISDSLWPYKVLNRDKSFYGNRSVPDDLYQRRKSIVKFIEDIAQAQKTSDLDPKFQAAIKENIKNKLLMNDETTVDVRSIT